MGRSPAITVARVTFGGSGNGGGTKPSELAHGVTCVAGCCWGAAIVSAGIGADFGGGGGAGTSANAIGSRGTGPEELAAPLDQNLIAADTLTFASPVSVACATSVPSSSPRIAWAFLRTPIPGSASEAPSLRGRFGGGSLACKL